MQNAKLGVFRLEQGVFGLQLIVLRLEPDVFGLQLIVLRLNQKANLSVFRLDYDVLHLND
jgi:hypothetical protein